MTSISTQKPQTTELTTQATFEKFTEQCADEILANKPIRSRRIGPTNTGPDRVGRARTELEATPVLPTVSLTRYTNDNGPLTKQFSHAADGSVEKTTAARLTKGRAETVHVRNLNELAKLIEGLKANQCLGFGTMGRPVAEITTKRNLVDHPDRIARSRAYFRYSKGPAIMMIDHDAFAGDEDKTPNELRDTLISACPPLASVPMLWTASASSCIFNERENRPVTGLRGQRLYFLVNCGEDIPRAGAALYERLWLTGNGQYLVSQSGSLLDRNIIDRSVWQPERCDFAAGATCNAPLTQRRPAAVILGPAHDELSPFNSLLITELSDNEKRRLSELKLAAKLTKEPERVKMRAIWLERRVSTFVANGKTSHAAATAALNRAADTLELNAEFILHSSDGSTVSVGEILAEPEKWAGQRFADPLEPDYRSDPRIASLDLHIAGKARLYTHAHGGQWFSLTGSRIPIPCEVGQLAAIADKCLDVLKGHHELFELGTHAIVRVADSGIIYTATPDSINDHLSRKFEFTRWNPRKEKLEPADVPKDLAKTILARHGARPLPELVGVITAPTLRTDGSILSMPGYDPASKLYYRQSAFDPPAVPEYPDRALVERAFGRLWEPFRQFPFASAASRGVMLAALLSATVRRSLPTCPAFAFDAPTAGSGKSLAARCTAVLSGSDASTSSPPGDDEEMRKVLLGFLRTSRECLIFDNVTLPIGGAAFNQFLTEPLFSGRVLGQSEIQTLRNNCLLLLTGNNLRIDGDACRRVLTARIDTVSENPHLRTFDFCPLAICREQRMELVIDALTILRGYITAGSPRVASGGVASFEAWHKLVRQAVCWVSTLNILVEIADPVDSILINNDTNPAQATIELLLKTWKTSLGSRFYSVSSVIEQLRTNPEVYEAIEKGLGNTITCYALAGWLRKNQGIPVSGLRLESRYNAGRKSMDWQVQDVCTTGS